MTLPSIEAGGQVISMLIVETVAPDSAAERAGLLPGDRLLHYDGQPLTSPFSLHALEDNTFGKPSVIVTILRDSVEIIEVEAAIGPLGLEARPDLDLMLLSSYQEGREAHKDGDHNSAGELWRQLGEATQNADDRVWLLWVAGTALGKANSWSFAHETYTLAWEHSRGELAAAAQIQLQTGLGNCDEHQSDFASAEAHHREALEIAERSGLLGWQARSANNLGLVANYRGDLALAQYYWELSLQIKENLASNSLDVAGILSNLGTLVYSRGDLALAQQYWERSLQIREDLAPNTLHVAASLNNLGALAFSRGDLERSRDYFERALKIKEQLDPNSLDVALTLNNLGSIAGRRGELALAQQYCELSLQIKQRLAPGSLGVASSFENLGNIALERGNLPLAQGYYGDSLRLYEHLGPGSLHVAEQLSNLGQVSRELRDFKMTHNLYSQAIEIVECQRSQVQGGEGRSLFVAKHLDIYLGLLQACLFLNSPAEGFATIERCHARSLVEMLLARQIDFENNAPADLLEQQQAFDLKRARAYAALAELSAGDGERVKMLHDELRDMERAQQALTAQIRQASPAYAALQYPQPLDLKGTQKALDAGTLLLSYMIGAKETYLFAVTSKRLKVVTIPVGQKELEEQVQRFRDALDVFNLESTPQQAIEQGHSLFNLLLYPVQSQLRKAQRLLLCPDGPLHILPFAALVTKRARKPRYLGQEKPLHTTFSMTVHAQTRQQQSAAMIPASTPPQPRKANLESIAEAVTSAVQHVRTVLALGDPLYGTGRGGRLAAAATRSSRRSVRDITSSQSSEVAALRSRGMSLQPLPHTREEVEAIGQLFGDQATVRTGLNATKTVAKSESGEVDIVHFACHGWLDGKMPLSSGLILSQPEALGKKAVDGDNGLLQAWEIFEQVRLKADLVVLSCCQSGLGQEVRGEGLIGLTRAFTYAGAKSVLVSLWEIHDASTAEFMKQFYTALKAGQSKDESLQAAIQSMIAHPRWNHPFYWAAFALHGHYR